MAASDVLSPEVLSKFSSDEYEDGDTCELRAPSPSPTIGAKKLLSIFDEPENAKAAPAIPLEFQGEDLKKAPPAPLEPAAASSISWSVPRPHAALFLTCSALLASTAAAFACARRGARAFCGQPTTFLPRGRRTRRRALLLGEESANATLEPLLADDLFSAVMHENGALDPEDAAAVVAAVEARSAKGAYRSAFEAAAAEDDEESFAAFEADYAFLSRAHVLDVRAHVLGRSDVSTALHSDPSRDLVDAVAASEGVEYEHAFERSTVKPVETAEGGFVLGLRQHILRGAEGLLHQDPSIDLEDLMAIKSKARANKLRARLAADRTRL